MKKLLSVFAAIVLVLGMAGVASAIYWADFVYDYTGYPNPNFRGGIDVDGDGYYESLDGDILYLSGVDPSVALGEPDESFVSIYEGEFITVGFSTPFLNGPGIDFYIVETGHANEGAYVSVSSDGTNFTSIGTVDVPDGGSNNTQFGDLYGFDLAGTFTEPVSYVKISDSVLGASPGFDLSGVGANYPVPEPATLFLLGSGLIGLAGLGRRKFK